MITPGLVVYLLSLNLELQIVCKELIHTIMVIAVCNTCNIGGITTVAPSSVTDRYKMVHEVY